MMISAMARQPGCCPAAGKAGFMKIIGLFILLIAFPGLWAQDWARTQLAKSPRHQEWVTVKYEGRSVETFIVYPESKDKRPVVVLIHEIFGMSDWVQDLADQV